MRRIWIIVCCMGLALSFMAVAQDKEKPEDCGAACKTKGKAVDAKDWTKDKGGKAYGWTKDKGGKARCGIDARRCRNDCESNQSCLSNCDVQEDKCKAAKEEE